MDYLRAPYKPNNQACWYVGTITLSMKGHERSEAMRNQVEATETKSKQWGEDDSVDDQGKLQTGGIKLSLDSLENNSRGDPGELSTRP